MRNSYVHIAQTLEIDKSNENQIWLKQAQEESIIFASTLSSWQTTRWLISTLGVFGIGLFVATSTANNIYVAILNLKFESFINVIGILTFFFFFISFSFDCKRSLFRPGSGFMWESILSQQQKESTKNVYLLEDRLFNILGMEKSREFPIDIVAFVLWLIVMGGILIVWQYIKSGSLLLIFMGSGFILIGIYGVISGMYDRKWR